jgi:thiol-disulfide isomerase/thioredoxin
MSIFLRKKKDIIAGVILGILLGIIALPYISDLLFLQTKGGIIITDEKYKNLPPPSSFDEKLDPESFLSSSTKPVILYFYTDWCGYCKKDLPYILSFKDEYQNKVEVIFINADARPDLMKSLHLKGIPQYLIFNPATKKLQNLTSPSFIGGSRFKREVEAVLHNVQSF